MLRKLPALFPVLIAAMLALAAWWLQYTISRQGPGPGKITRDDPDAIVENFRITRFNEEGALSASIEGPRMRHFPVDDRSVLDRPVATFLTPDSPLQNRWRSNEAVITERGDRIELRGQVLGQRDGDARYPALELRTEAMTVLPREELAYTSAPLEARRGRMQLSGNGGRWNNLKGHLEIWQLDATLPRNDSAQ